MLTQNTVAKLSVLTHRTNAQRMVCWIPLGGIYWDDEMPDIQEFVCMPEGDRNLIFRLFGIRVKLWQDELLTEDEQQVWEETQSQVPSWAFWQRRAVTAEDQQAQIDAAKETANGLEQLLADADEVSVSEDNGVQSFSATFNLREGAGMEPNQPLWKRFLRKWR